MMTEQDQYTWYQTFLEQQKQQTAALNTIKTIMLVFTVLAVLGVVFAMIISASQGG